MRSRPCETVMLVNDDPSFVDVVGDALRAQGLAVLLVPGVRQAIAALGSGFQPDAVLLDVELERDVRELVRAVRTTPRLSEVALIAVSREDQQMVQLTEDGGFHSFTAPTDARALSVALDEICGRGRDEREWDPPLVGHA